MKAEKDNGVDRNYFFPESENGEQQVAEDKQISTRFTSIGFLTHKNPAFCLNSLSRLISNPK